MYIPKIPKCYLLTAEEIWICEFVFILQYFAAFIAVIVVLLNILNVFIR